MVQGLCRDMRSEAEQGRLPGCTHHVHLYVVSSSINGMLVALERLFREFAWRPPAIFKMFSHAVWSYVQSIDTVSTQHHKRGAKAHF